MGFSREIRHNQIEKQEGRCAILGLQVDVLECHHCMPKIRGGSNNPHNCISLAGHDAYCGYGFPVENVHDRFNLLALEQNLFLHPDTLELVTRRQMPEDCFKGRHSQDIQPRRKKHKRRKYRRW